MQITAHQESTLEAPIWMTPLDPAGDHRISSPTKRAITITKPRIPGLEVRLPAGTVINDDAGHVVRDLNITAVPVDRPPFPLPLFDRGPAVLHGAARPGVPEQGRADHLPQLHASTPPGSASPFWNYDPTGRGWYIYGEGTVTPTASRWSLTPACGSGISPER